MDKNNEEVNEEVVKWVEVFCPKCGGTGRLECNSANAGVMLSPCNSCRGTGKIKVKKNF